MRAPAVAAITLDPTGGGVAVVAHLIWRVLHEQWPERAQLIEMFRHENRPATWSEKLRFALALLRAQSLGSTDWVLFSHLGLAQVQDAIPAALRCRYGVFLHGVEAWRPLTAVELRVLEHADLRLANSTYTATRIMDTHPSLGPIDACPLALPPSGAVANDDDQHQMYGRHAVLVVGRMLAAERYKGHDQLIDAWPRVVDCVPDAMLVIVGDGDDSARLKQKAAASPAATNITFTGFVSKRELDRLYTQAALFALPSRGEGFGLVYLEAMSHGLACIGSIHDAASEVIDDNVTGLLVNGDNRQALSDAIGGLLTDAARRRAMGAAGAERVAREFSFDRFKRRLLDRLLAADRSLAGA